MPQHMCSSRLVAVGQVDTAISPPHDTTWAAEVTRLEVVFGTRESNSGISSKQQPANAAQSDNNNSKVRTGEMAVWGTTVESRGRIGGSRIRTPTATASHGRRYGTRFTGLEGHPPRIDRIHNAAGYPPNLRRSQGAEPGFHAADLRPRRCSCTTR